MFVLVIYGEMALTSASAYLLIIRRAVKEYGRMEGKINGTKLI
jgi:hypothetical protein